MGKRAEAVEETRRRIVQATLDLHAEQGPQHTSWDEIALRAGVGVGTVYRHFPTFNELLPACGELTWQKLAIPGPEIFEGLETESERLLRLAEALFSLYERGERELSNIREARDFHPVMKAAHEEVEMRLLTLVTAAVEESRPLVRALTDLFAWKALRENGVADPAATVAALLAKR